MLIVNCDSFKSFTKNKGFEIEVEDGYFITKGTAAEIIGNSNLCFNEIKEYFERRGYKIEAL
ncbi:hypothetical protein [Photorhabdus cinerea]|nr:hypothetical protein [Photorhabdus cinerea]NHB94541.1 hypothetical protein [Photorhabdus cinerea]